jgi:hypothetical protein
MAIYEGRHINLGHTGTRPNAAGIEYAARIPYAWPGGYPTYILADDSEVICSECTRANYRQIRESTRDNARDGWTAVAVSCTQDDEHDTYCANCNAQLVTCWLANDAKECTEGCAKSAADLS